MELLAIKEKLEDNAEFIAHPDCTESIEMSVQFFARVGYYPPWIGYYARENNQLVGTGAFKGKPTHNKVEIAYSTFPAFQQKGMATEICKQLVQLALRSNPSVIITARTLPEENYSTKILKKNNFECKGLVMDEDDGEVWEWQYERND
jgi:[ribosomal protein S5]-alanine N-acetyltransferase